MSEHSIECLHENDWGKLWEIIKSHSIHVLEGDKSGGWRDRLIMVENEISALKKAMWTRVITAGIIGGLIGSGSSDVIKCFFQWIMKR